MLVWSLKSIVKLYHLFEMFFVEDLIDNLIKRILLTMKVYSNPMISK